MVFLDDFICVCVVLLPLIWLLLFLMKIESRIEISEAIENEEFLKAIQRLDRAIQNEYKCIDDCEQIVQEIFGDLDKLDKL